MLFKEFDNLDSAEEINQKAAELLEAGDVDAIRRFAEENGIDKEDAEAYVDGEEERMCSILMAAVGKLKMEEKELKIGGELSIWAGYVMEMCTEVKDMAAVVRKKDKSLAECMARLVRFSFEHKVRVSDNIVDITKVTQNGKEEKMRKPLYLSGMTRADAKRLIREYYLGR